MNILGIDVSGKSAGICLEKDDTILFEEVHSLGLTHSETLLPLVEKALLKVECPLPEIDCIAITTGPGSFTGLRIGLALVKGLAFAGNIPVAPVSTLQAMAVGCGLQGTVLCALDARRDQVYWALFSCNGEKVERLTEDRASSVAVVAEELAKKVENSIFPIIFIGDGAEMCYNALDDLQDKVEVNLSAGSFMAKGVTLEAKKMAELNTLACADTVNPTYLRLSQAERERAEKMSTL